MKAYERGYLRARAEISADKDGDIFGQKRRYLPAKPHKGLTDKVHIVVIIPPTGSNIKVNYLSFASDFSLSGGNRELVKGQFHCSDLFVV